MRVYSSKRGLAIVDRMVREAIEYTPADWKESLIARIIDDLEADGKAVVNVGPYYLNLYGDRVIIVELHKRGVDIGETEQPSPGFVRNFFSVAEELMRRLDDMGKSLYCVPYNERLKRVYKSIGWEEPPSGVPCLQFGRNASLEDDAEELDKLVHRFQVAFPLASMWLSIDQDWENVSRGSVEEAVSTLVSTGVFDYRRGGIDVQFRRESTPMDLEGESVVFIAFRSVPEDYSRQSAEFFSNIVDALRDMGDAVYTRADDARILRFCRRVVGFRNNPEIRPYIELSDFYGDWDVDEYIVRDLEHWNNMPRQQEAAPGS